MICLLSSKQADKQITRSIAERDWLLKNWLFEGRQQINKLFSVVLQKIINDNVIIIKILL